jgi:hypothetical protein
MQVKKAVVALKKHQEISAATQQSAQLFENDKLIHLQIVLNKIPARAGTKPITVFALPPYDEFSLRSHLN